MRHLIMNLESPLMAFGGETIDNYGVVRWFPSASMLTGLLANALGWRRIERQRHQRLQDRLIFAARIDREPRGRLRLRDFQTAQLDKNDKGWTTRGRPEGRAGGANTYDAPHLRFRDYFADMRVTIALRLQSENERPTLYDLESALEQPARPLFIGRKPCLPSARLFAGLRTADSALAALSATPLEPSPDSSFGAAQEEPDIRLFWPAGEEAEGVEPNRTYMLTDQRNWDSGLHGGGRAVREGSQPRKNFPVDREPRDEERS